MNRYIKLDVISHFNNTKKYQIMSLSGNNYIPENMYEKIQMISPYLQNISDIRFPIEINLHTTLHDKNFRGSKNSRLHNLKELFSYFLYENNLHYFWINTINGGFRSIIMWCGDKDYYEMLDYENNPRYNLFKDRINKVKSFKEKMDILNNMNQLFEKCYPNYSINFYIDYSPTQINRKNEYIKKNKEMMLNYEKN